MRATLVVCAALFVLSVAYWVAADAIPASRLAGQVGADGLPKLLGVALGVLSLVLAAQTVFEKRRANASPIGTEDETKVAKGLTDWSQHFKALGLIGLGVGYLVALPLLGYAVSSALLLAAVAVYGGLRPSRNLFIFAVVGGAIFYLIFVKLLGIPLPAGFWPSLFG